MGHGPTGGVESQFLADWQHQQVNRTGTSAFPRCAGQLVAKAKRRAAAEIYTPGSGMEGGARPTVRTRCSHR